MIKEYLHYHAQLVLVEIPVPPFYPKEYELVKYDTLKGEAKKFLAKKKLSELEVEGNEFYRRVVTDPRVTSVIVLGRVNKSVVTWLNNNYEGVMQPLASDAKNGLFHFTKDANVVFELLNEMDILEEAKLLPTKKLLNRITKLLGNCAEIKFKPTIKFVEGGYGLVYVKREWAEKNGIPYGGKLTGTMKSLVVFMSKASEKKGFDMIVPKDENKWNLDAEKLARTITWDPTLSPKNRFSALLRRGKDSEFFGRNPNYGIAIRAMSGERPTPDLTEIKAFYNHGTWTEKLLDKLFSYTKDGVKTLSSIGMRIKGSPATETEKAIPSTSPFDISIWNDVDKVIGKYVRNLWIGKITGVYSTALPLSHLPKGCESRIKIGWVFRPPIMMPIKAHYAIYKSCIYVDEFMWDKVFHGDFDGDLAFVIHTKNKNRTTGQYFNTGLDYFTMKDKLIAWSAIPNKSDKPVDAKETIGKAIEDVVHQASSVGGVHNNGKILIDILRKLGWPKEKVDEMEMIITNTFVQPVIDGFKYNGVDKMPTLVSMMAAYSIEYMAFPATTNPKDLATQAKAIKDGLKREYSIYNGVCGKRNSLTTMINTAKDCGVKADGNSFYEPILAHLLDVVPRKSATIVKPVVKAKVYHETERPPLSAYENAPETKCEVKYETITRIFKPVEPVVAKPSEVKKVKKTKKSKKK